MAKPVPLSVRLTTLVLALVGPTLLWVSAWLAGGVLAPGDGLGYYMPARATAAAAWLSGVAPLWNPFQFSGMPLLAAIQTGALYPGNFPFLLLAPGPAMNLTVCLAYAAAGGAMWLYARALNLQPMAALLAALVFAGSGYMVAHMEHLTMLQAASLIPALFWAVERYAQTARVRFVLLFAVFLALQILAGYPQTTVVTGLLLGPYALMRLVSIGLASTWRQGLVFGASLVLAASIGVGLAGAQLCPTAELMASSVRNHLTYAQLVDDALPARQLPTLLFPFLYGVTPGAIFHVPAWGEGPWHNELMGYPGLLTWMLAGLGVVLAFGQAVPRYWLAVCLLALLLALGGQTPLYQLWASLPGLSIMRVPGRHLLEVDLALALLAAFGLNGLLAARRDLRERAAWQAALAVSLPMAAIVGLLAFGRTALAARWQPFAPKGMDVATALAPWQPALWSPLLVAALSAGALVWLAKQPQAGRQALLVLVLFADLLFFGLNQGWRGWLPDLAAGFERPVLNDAPRKLVLSSNPYPYHDVAATRELGYPQVNAFTSWRLVNGYEPIMPTHYGPAVGKMSMGGHVSDPGILALGHHALDVLRMGELRLDSRLYQNPVWGDPIEAHPRWKRLPDEGAVVVYRNHRALPRIWRPTRVIARSEADLALSMRQDRAFDPRRTALVTGKVPLAPAFTPGEAWMRTLGFGLLRLHTKGTGPGLLVVSERYAPGWQASLGDRPLPVRQVDGLVIGVEVPAGEQTVLLQYRPAIWERGLLVSAFAALALGLWALLAVLGAWKAPRAEGWR